MRYETQQDILRLLNLLTRHYACAALSLKVTRSFDAERILTFACMASIADVVLRTSACDVPAASSLHYSGEAHGPVKPYCFDDGAFAMESQFLQYQSPEEMAVRTQVLDYFYQLRKNINDDHVMFKFEDGMQIGAAERAYFDQLCLQLGFNRENINQYITGEDPSILDLYPELGYCRDLMFMCRLTMVKIPAALVCCLQVWRAC
jgi:hypothetical protein